MESTPSEKKNLDTPMTVIFEGNIHNTYIYLDFYIQILCDKKSGLKINALQNILYPFFGTPCIYQLHIKI